MDKLIYRAYREWQPKEGWLPLLLIFAIGSTVITAVLKANWVPEAGVVGWTVTLSLLLTIILAKRQISWIPASLLLTGYGLVISIIFLARLVPPFNILSAGLSSSMTYIRQNLFLFGDRIGGWLEAVINGQSSEETIVFAIGLGLLSWFFIAYASWATYRQKSPLNGLIVIGSALALNILYGNGTDWTLIIFISLAVLLTAVIHIADMQQLWDQRQIDYPTDIKIELILTAGAVALSLMAFSFVLPAINIRTITRTFIEQPVVQEAEKSFERIFAGVNVDSGLSSEVLERGAGGSSLPRSFLLGNPPELAETLVMTATVQTETMAETGIWPVHWRAYSYDIYNGRGWSVSSEREEVIPAGEQLPTLSVNSPRFLTQSVFWQLGSTTTRYTMGLPVRFDHDVTVHWRGVSDLSQARGQALNYTAESQTISAKPTDLRQSRLSDVPDTILARYTALPNDIPDRVIQLAQEATSAGANEPPTIYDQTKAIEQFLRQYPYTLDLPLPPANQDLVDYFLFDIQSGYCDYYASAMVVMARSLGIPARFATGFLAQPPDENGVQHIYQLNAHSWAEVYFEGYGWVEFEPTAPFPTQSQSDQLPDFQPSQPPEFATPNPLGLPQSTTSNPASILTNRYFLVVLFMFLAAITAVIWMSRGRKVQQDSVLSAYSRLQRSANRIGQRTPDSQTPIEFGKALARRLDHLAQKSRIANRFLSNDQDLSTKLPTLAEETDQLTNLFIAHQYGPEELEQDSVKAKLIWDRIRLRLWLLSVLNKFRRNI